MGKSKSFTLPFIKKEQIAKDTYSFFFDRSKEQFDFLPGQYVRLHLPHNADEKGTSRHFTIASSPHEKNILMFTIRIYDSSFKKTLYNLKPGDKGNFFGPMGWFLLPKDEDKEKVFIAGGIGVTPFHSLLHFLSEEKDIQPITLFVSFSKKEDIIFHEAFQAITKKNKKIRVIYTITQEKIVDKNWQGEKGRLSEKIFKKYLSDLQQPVFYIVGSETTVAGIKTLLLATGIPEANIQTEDFTGY